MNELTELKKYRTRMLAAKDKIEKAENRQWDSLGRIIGTDAMESFKDAMIDVFKTKAEADDLLKEIQGKIDTHARGLEIWGGGAER
jgi:uncharacterized protein with ParB-like and HNH nuclease domain